MQNARVSYKDSVKAVKKRQSPFPLQSLRVWGAGVVGLHSKCTYSGFDQINKYAHSECTCSEFAQSFMPQCTTATATSHLRATLSSSVKELMLAVPQSAVTRSSTLMKTWQAICIDTDLGGESADDLARVHIAAHIRDNAIIGCKCKNNQWILLLSQVYNLSALMRNIANISSRQRTQYSLVSGADVYRWALVWEI